MLKIFNSPFRVTQKFGARPEYYKQFGLMGHEGLDIVPTGSDWTIFSMPYKGIVVKDVDMGDKGGAYGIHNTIWYPDIKKAFEYCHLASNRIYLDQEISPTSPIGIMGGTGNVTGPHLHLNMFEVDERGYRQNKNNGYLGGIDPLPFLMQTIGEMPTNTDIYKDKGVALLDEYRKNRVQGPEGNWEGFANAIIGSDRDVIGLRSDLATSHDTLKKASEQCELDKTAIKKDDKLSFETEQKLRDKEWQSKVESAKKSTLNDYSAGQLIGAGLTKIFGGGGNNG
jgi:hypothetical protein